MKINSRKRVRTSEYKEKESDRRKTDEFKNKRNSYLKKYRLQNKHIFAWRALLSNTKRLNKVKNDRTIKLLGYSALELKEHIKSLFTEGMSWENSGEWHVDHIKMVSSFDPETPVSVVNSLDNLRPLWAEDNCSRKFN